MGLIATLLGHLQRLVFSGSSASKLYLAPLAGGCKLSSYNAQSRDTGDQRRLSGGGQGVFMALLRSRYHPAKPVITSGHLSATPRTTNQLFVWSANRA